jgi:hypothetical protein
MLDQAATSGRSRPGPGAGLLLQGFFKTDVENIGHHLGDGIHILQGDIEGPSHIANHRPGFQFSEGDNLGHVIPPAVPLHHVVDNLFPPLMQKSTSISGMLMRSG